MRWVMNKYVIMVICFVVWKIARAIYLQIIRSRGYSHVPIVIWLIILLGTPVYWLCWYSGQFILQMIDVCTNFESGNYQLEHSKFIDSVIARMQLNRAKRYLKEELNNGS